MSNTQMIPLAQLRLSDRNVRRTGESNVDELAASISAEGLLNNLVVTAANDGFYDVADGGRRLLALQQLERDGRLHADLTTVQCLVVDDERATEAGLTANIMRQAMHPADEFVAFRLLTEEGKTVDEIAERFGKTVRYIQQRLKLANVKPDLFELYRAGGMTLDQLTALASTSNHELQRQAWETNRNSWERAPQHLRNFIARESVRGDQPLPLFVGLEAYQAAGGKVRTDLFTEEVWLTDLVLLDTLAADRLEQMAERLRGEGWSWVDAQVHMDYAERQTYGTHPKRWDAVTESFATPQDETRHAEIENRLEVLQEELDEAPEGELAEQLEAEGERLQNERDAIDSRKVTLYPADVMAESGVLLVIDDRGLNPAYALLRPGQKVSKSGEISAPTSAPAKDAPKKKPELSDAVKECLSAHRSEVARFHLAQDPTLAQCVLIERLLMSHWGGVNGGNGLKLTFDRATDASKVADVHKSVRAGLQMALEALKIIPRKDTLAFLLKQTEKWRLEVQAFLVAAHFEGITPSSDGHPGVAAIHRITGINMADHWTPATDNFLGRIHADLLAQAVKEAKGKDSAAQLAGLKKDERMALGAKLLAGTGWLPSLLRGPNYGVTPAKIQDSLASAKKAKPATKVAKAKPEPVAAKKAVKKATVLKKAPTKKTNTSAAKKKRKA